VRRAALALLTLLALAGAACGSDENDEQAAALLERGLGTDVDSGTLLAEMEIELEGVQEAEEPFRLRLEGPFRSRGATEMPDLDMAFRVSWFGRTFSGRVVALPENAWVEYKGETYEVGEENWSSVLESLTEQEGAESFEEAGVDPLDWVAGADTDGEDEMGGVTTTKVTAELDVERMLGDFGRLAGEGNSIPERTLDDIDDALGPVEVEAWIAEDDIWRRLRGETEFEVPQAERDAFGGLEGGRVSLDMVLERPNEPVEIEGLGEARPIAELLQALGIPPESFGLPSPEPL
jgi:hypothetical protein